MNERQHSCTDLFSTFQHNFYLQVLEVYTIFYQLIMMHVLSLICDRTSSIIAKHETKVLLHISDVSHEV